jgi:HK97 family phage major capsid protein
MNQQEKEPQGCLETKQLDYDSALAELSQLAEADNLTPEQFSRARQLEADLDLMESQQKHLREQQQLKSRLQARRRELFEPVNTPSFESRVGTTVTDAFGRTIEEEGFALGEKQMRGISEPSYRNTWMRMARTKHLDQADYKTLQVGLDETGGYLVPPDILQHILRREPQSGSLVDLVRTVPVSSDRLQIPRLGYEEDDVYSNPMRIRWTSEIQGPQDVVSPEFGQVEIPVYEGSMRLPVTRTLLEDASVPLDQILAEELAGSYRLGLEEVIVSGNGVGKPSGILTALNAEDDAPESVLLGDPVTADGLLELVYGLPPQYAQSAVAVLNRTGTYADLVKLKDQSGQYVFGLGQIPSGGLATPRQDTLLGYPLHFSPMMPEVGSDRPVILFGDLRRAYFLAQRLGISVRVQDIPSEPYVYYVVRFRVGGKLVQPRAIRVGVQADA